MGAIGGEDLMKWEKMEGVANGNEEKILVLVRLRPLSEKEVARNEVSDWESINDNTVLFRNSLQERSMFPTAYTFDRVYGGDCSTRQVYETGAKGIALSVVSGINSSIFAYGQTSSGKTYTMIGITEYTVADIYDYMERHEERAFVLKFSAIEIYNEAVRDLLSTENMPLRLLDDPDKGTIVERLTEVIVRDWSHVKELLSICEAQRKVGETSLNETSSRSHQILRLTIESSAREFIGKDKSTTLSASVNFVDLAGSERASQALSVGQRLKEGCHINRSLLTLSTVIRKLSKGRNGHVNYRDSKLTRILQPSLGGNARTAIICTLSPARDHVEQSRNTLLFASCAKEVSTNAQVNVVMSDKALVKHLQKEVARLESELRTPAPSTASDYTALLRKKDMQIEKLEKEVRELTKQRDLAQSRIEELLHAVRNDQDTNEWDELCHHPKCQRSTYEHDCSASESSGVVDSHRLEIGVKIFKSTEVQENGSLPNTPSPSTRSEIVSDRRQNSTDFALRGEEDSGDNCREVRCIEETDGSNDDNSLRVDFSNVESQRRMLGLSVADEEPMSTLLPNESQRRMLRPAGFGALEQRFHDVQQTINSLVTPYPDEEAPHMSTPSSFKFTRSRSCRANLMTGSYSQEFEMVENTPPNSFERNFPGRPERKMWNLSPFSHGASNSKLSRNDSQSSIVSSVIEEQNGLKNKVSGDEDIPSVDTFVAGLKKMAKLHGDQIQGTGSLTGKNVRDVGLDPMGPPPSDWPVEFKRQQRLILELWEACNVSLIHRTYFFLLFKGDPMDSIYMEVEVRRLSFLKETFSKGNPAVEDGRTLTLASSMKALRREREMLSRLMNKRFSDEERKIMFQKWGINLDSKRRRMQLVHRLWSETEDSDHIKESASIIAKLIRFSEQGQALKEMFGLSFTPPRMTRRSLGWKNSMASLL